jgi:NAD(P)-dependent dehydrogenase (short-subunit alcohol dehydrogenase family)
MSDPARMFDLSERHALVVGAASGIGRAGAMALAAFGAVVVCADIDVEGAEQTAAAIEAAQGAGRASARALDVTSSEDCRTAAQELGETEILLITPAVNRRKPLIQTTDEDYEHVLGVNLMGTYRLLREFGTTMSERGRGSIIAMASVRARSVERGQGLYGASKAGLVLMVQALAEEIGDRGVRVNTIAPAGVETALSRPIREDPGWYEAFATKPMLRRWAQPEEMGGAIVFLASDASSYVTGSMLAVDGGWLGNDGRFTPPGM